MRLYALTLTAAYALTAALTAPVTIKVSPAVVLVGQGVTLTCRVSPEEGNRRLSFGIEGSERERSDWQLNGAEKQQTWGPFRIERIPCDVGVAYCEVQRADGRVFRVTQALTVGGCDE